MTWPTVQLRRLFRVVNGGTPTSDPANWGGGIPWATPVDLARVDGGHLSQTDRSLTATGLTTGSRQVRAGSLLVSTRAPIGYVAETMTAVAFNQGCRGLEPQRPLSSRYFRYQLSAERRRLESIGQGSTFVELSSDGLASLDVVVPPIVAQLAIVDFLDTETARIDALITKKHRMISLLEERLALYVRSRLAKVDTWLPLKRRWSVVDCKHRTPTYTLSGYPVISPGDVTAGRLDLSRADRFVNEDEYQDLADAVRRPKRGDIIYSRNASVGIASYVDTDQPFCMGQDVCLITSSRQDQRYLTYILNTVGLDQLDGQKLGSTFGRINVAQIVELSIPTPSPTAQRALGSEFDRASARSDATTSRLQRQIELLQQHRQALITAAVTGEMDVPGVAA